MALYEFIIRVENTHRKKIMLEKEEQELITPIIKDYDQVGEIYGIFSDEISRKTNLKLNSIESRRIFILIVMRLFCPAVFVGRKLKHGIRNKMASILGCEASVISHDFRNLTFHYKKYKHFRETVDMIYDAIMETLSEN